MADKNVWTEPYCSFTKTMMKTVLGYDTNHSTNVYRLHPVDSPEPDRAKLTNLLKVGFF